MPIERFFTNEDNITIGSQVILTDAELHHLIHVTRISEGEKVGLVNGRGILAHAVVTHVRKREAELLVENVEMHPSPSKEVILVQAIPRINRLDFILEKGTELGMSEIWLFPGKRSERKQLTPSQLEHMRAVTIAAMKQCGRLHLPHIELRKSILEWSAIDGKAFFGDLSADAPAFKDVWTNFSLSSKVLFFIGPESGFTEEEEHFLRKMHVQGVKLHDNILRTDTAAIVALSLMTQA